MEKNDGQSCQFGAVFQRTHQQAWLFGAKFVFSREVTGVRQLGTKKRLLLSDGREIVTTAVVVATGAKYRRLDVPSLERFVGRSIFYTTFGESRLVQDLDVVVAGGGNSAGQAVVHLAAFARQITLVVRADSLEKSMSNYLVQQIHRTPNIDVMMQAEVVGGEGGELLERLAIRDKRSNLVENIKARLLFVLIGATPNTDWLSDTVQRDARGSIVTGHDVDLSLWPLQRKPMNFETSMPGLFAVGDARLGSAKRVASAVGDGAAAAQNIHQYLREMEQPSVRTENVIRIDRANQSVL